MGAAKGHGANAVGFDVGERRKVVSNAPNDLHSGIIVDALDAELGLHLRRFSYYLQGWITHARTLARGAD